MIEVKIIIKQTSPDGSVAVFRDIFFGHCATQPEMDIGAQVIHLMDKGLVNAVRYAELEGFENQVACASCRKAITSDQLERNKGLCNECVKV